MITTNDHGKTDRQIYTCKVLKKSSRVLSQSVCSSGVLDLLCYVVSKRPSAFSSIFVKGYLYLSVMSYYDFIDCYLC